MNGKLLIASIFVLNYGFLAIAMEPKQKRQQGDKEDSLFAEVFAKLSGRTKEICAQNDVIRLCVDSDVKPIAFSRNPNNLYRNFDNMAFSVFLMDEKLFACAEEAFHYMKYKTFGQEALWDKEFGPTKNKTVFADLGDEKQGYKNTNDYADEAKRVGRLRFPEYVLHTWDEKKFDILFDILKIKFAQNPELAEQLKNTGKAMVYEFAANDSTYGTGNDGKGQNQLGILLVKVRELLNSGELKVESPDFATALATREAAAKVEKSRIEKENAALEAAKNDKKNAELRKKEIEKEFESMLNKLCDSNVKIEAIESKINDTKRNLGLWTKNKGTLEDKQKIESEKTDLEKELSTHKNKRDLEKEAIPEDLRDALRKQAMTAVQEREGKKAQPRQPVKKK